MTSVSSTTSSTSSTSSTTSSASSSSDIQDRFLTLLVAQMTNQDPLDPMDNNELTTQLAQISTVTGIENVNTTLESLVDSLADSQAIQSANLVGQTVLVPGKNLALTSTTSTDGTTTSAAYGAVKLASDADSVTVTIKNSSGTVVQTLELGEQDAGVVTFGWDGSTSSNTTADAGSYTFSVSAKADSTSVTATALQYGTVGALTRNTSGDFVLDLGTLGQYALSDVQQVI